MTTANQLSQEIAEDSAPPTADGLRRFHSLFRSLPGDRPVLGLLAGGGFFAVASVLRWQFGDMSEGFGPMTFLPAILLAGLYGGIRIGLAMAAACFLVSWVMFFPPYGTFTLATSHRITMLIFTVTAALELYVIRSLNLAISDLSEARERSSTLFRELQHRVANNLQFVAALLQLRRKTLTQDSDGAHALEDAEARLRMMSRVHRRLHDPGSVDQPVEVYLEALCLDLIATSNTPEIEVTVWGDPIVLDLETLMSLSLIVAELVTNSLKHAFQNRDDGWIKVDLRSTHAGFVLTVADDGPGLPKSFGKAGSGSLGLGILQSLAKQLHGKISFEPGPGTVAKLVFRP